MNSFTWTLLGIAGGYLLGGLIVYKAFMYKQKLTCQDCTRNSYYEGYKQGKFDKEADKINKTDSKGCHCGCCGKWIREESVAPPLRTSNGEEWGICDNCK